MITVQRNGNASSTASVDYRTLDDLAIAGEDYTAVSGSLEFAPGQVARTIAILILDDALIETNETFSIILSNPVGAALGSQNQAILTILDNDLALGDLERKTIISGLNQPTTFDWTPDGQYLFIAQKNGVVRVVNNGVLRSTPLVDLSFQVNNERDRGLLGLAIHPNFPNLPYLYLSYTYDPPETQGNSGLAGPDRRGNRPARLVRLTVNPVTMTADLGSLEVIAGTNSTWANTSRPDTNSTGAVSIPP